MSEFEFDIDGLEQMERDIKKAMEKAPEKVNETLLGIAKDFKKTAKKKANAELKKHEREASQKKAAIKRKWGHKLLKGNLETTALVWNSAKHFHLIEYGHNVVRGGRVVGFAPGRHIMEKTRNDYQGIVPERFERMVDDILRESDLD